MDLISYVLCYATSFTLGTMFGMYVSYLIIKWIKEKKLW